MVRKRRESKQIAIVVLEGIKVSSEDTGLVPLCKAMRELVKPGDEIIVLTILSVRNASDQPSPSNPVGGNFHHCSHSCETDPHIRFLREEISSRKEGYLTIFRPFYYSCKSNGVKFQVKIAAGFRPKDIIIEEANNVKATWIVMDQCFAKYLTFQLPGTYCNVSVIRTDEEGLVRNFLPVNDAPESSSARDTARNPKSPKLRKGSTSSSIVNLPSSFPPVDDECQPSSSSYPQSICNEFENQTSVSEPHPVNERLKETVSHESRNVEQKRQNARLIKANLLLGQPLQLTWELILEITQEFKSRICHGQPREYMSYYGYLEEHQSFVLVKRYKGDSVSILEAELKAGQSLQHKNILPLIGYYRSEDEIILVCPFEIEGTLDKHICDLSRKIWELTFQDKLKIAIGIAQGIRYMHEECPRGPIAHGKLQPNNIFLSSNLQPMIAAFEHAVWLQLKQETPAFSNRYQHEDCLEHGSMKLIKSDIYAFGVLLLRLFCKRSVPQDDKLLIEWAHPLLIDRAFHLLLDENSDELDTHGVFRVMCTARMCTMGEAILRPSITEVISTLKGEDFCIIQASPSENSV